MDLCPEALGAECSLRREPSLMEGILSHQSEMPLSSSYELTWFDKLAAVMHDSCSKLVNPCSTAHS